ncbi:MAG: PKD domain-containing protein [Oscillospiraceae bacterium]|nr:PKD domain-containing protein [Oscillospiraceae bacterium]
MENYGFGEAVNLNINSGQLKIESNQSGMITDFEILESSFGSQSGSEFKLAFGNVPAATQVFNEETGEWDVVPGKVSGYWTVRWNMPVSDEPYEGEFREFKATLTHKDYKGVQLNPLITAVHTAIIGKDGVLAKEDGTGGLTLVNEGTTGFVDYLLDLSSGLRVPIHVPDSLAVTAPYDGAAMTVRVPAAAKSVTARHQVLMIAEPEGCGNIASVTVKYGDTEKTISAGNFWKDYGYIYIVDEIPTAYDAAHNVQPAEADYTIAFGNAARLTEVNYSRFIYTEVEAYDEGAIQLGRGTTGYYRKDEVFYNTGINPDVGDPDVRLLAVIDNRSRDVLSGYVVFTATPVGSDTPEFRSGEIAVAKVQPYAVAPIYCSDWVPERGTTYTITAELHENGGKLIHTLSSTAVINDLPYSHAGADIVDAVMGKPVRFDGSASYDKDGYVASFVWDFGDGESGFGPTPTHVYQHAGTYRASLYVSDNNLSTTYPYSRDAVTDEIISATKTDYNLFSEIQVTVLADCPDLFVSNLTFSSNTPDDGETVTATATIQNGTLPNTGGLTSTGEDAYYLVGFYQNDTFIGFKEVRGDLAVGATTTVSFDFKATAGAQKISAVVNDIGRNVREVNYDNNRRDAVLHGSATDFADLAVTSFTVALTDGDTISWGQPIEVSAVVKNIGSTAASAFKVLVYDNGTLIGSQLIDALSAGAVETVDFTWRPDKAGKHTLTFTADGPISAVVELDESNNTETLDYTAITVLYPDLTVKEITSSLSGTTVAPGQNIVLSALVENLGPGDAALPTTVAFYAGSRLIGTAETHTIKAGESELVSILWQDPAVTVTSIAAVADAYEALTEIAESNNRTVLTFGSPLKVSSAILAITDVTTVGAARYGDAAETTVTLKNNGDRAIDEPFTVALYAGANRVGTATCDSLAAGETASFCFSWTAEQSGDVLLRAFADAESKLVLDNRGLASVSKTLSVAPGLLLSGGAENSAYCVGDTVAISVSAFSSSAVYLPIAADAFSATLNGAAITLTYNAAEGAYVGSVTAETVGENTITCTASYGGVEQTLTSAFTVAEDFRVTLSNADQQSYGIGATIPVSGFVKTPAGVGISGVPVTVTAVGSERYTVTAVTAADGSYTCKLNLPDDVGGAFTLRASATDSGVTHLSDRVTFYVDGLYLALDDAISVTQGYEVTLAGFLNNPGVTAESVDPITVSGLPSGLTYTVLSAPSGTLAAASGKEVRIALTASETLTPGDYTITVQSGSAKRAVKVTCEKAYAVARIAVFGNTESTTEGLQANSVTLSIRQGDTASSAIRLTNIGTAPIVGVSATADLPFVTVQGADEEAVIQPVNRGYSIRDPQGALTLIASISPSESCATGVYKGTITLTSASLAEPVTIPVLVSVGAGLVGTTVFEIRNQDNTLLPGATVTLIGQDEQKDPVRFDAVADENALVTFENIPAGDYMLKATAPSHTTQTATISVAAVIDRTPRIITLDRQLFTFEVDESTLADLRSVSTASPNYSNLVYQAKLLADSKEPQLLPNFIGDEKQFYYQSGKLQNKISFKNPDEAGVKIEGITVRITDLSAEMPENAVFFSLGGNLTPIRKIASLAPGEVFDVVWALDLEQFFRQAVITPTENEGEFAIVFPSETTREEIDAYIAANDPTSDGRFTEVSYDEATHSGIYHMEGGAVPSDRVPLYYGERPYNFDFTLLASGVRADNGKTVETRVPVRVHYVAPDYLVEAGEQSPYDADGNYIGQQYGDIYDIYPDLKQKVTVEPAFAPASGRTTTMSYSTGFLNAIQANTPQVPDDNGDVGLSFGFGADAGYEGQITNLNMKLTNPSPMHPMEDVTVKLVLSDAPYDENGHLVPGGLTLQLPLTITVSGGEYTINGNKVDCDFIEPGGYLDIDYLFRLDEFTNIFTSFTKLDESLTPYLTQLTKFNKLYARIEGSFLQNGQEYNFVSGVREYEVKEQPKIYISYDLEDLGAEHYVLRATVTNLGAGDATNFTLGTPSVPNTGFDMKIVDVSTTKGKVIRGKNVSFDSVVIDRLRSGDTAVVTFDLAIVGQLTDAQKISLGKLAALPTVPIKTQNEGTIVVAPMKLENLRDQKSQQDIEELIYQLGLLNNNITLLTNKTSSELGRSLADYYDYSASLRQAISIGECYAIIANLVSLYASVKDISGIPDSVKEKVKELKELNELLHDPSQLKTMLTLGDYLENAKLEIWDLLLGEDASWLLEYLPLDFVSAYDTYQDAEAAVLAVTSYTTLNETFSKYLSLNRKAAALLKTASAAIDTAMKSKDSTTRLENTKIARVNMEEAAKLLAEAAELKSKGDDLLGNVNSAAEDADGDYSGYSSNLISIKMNAYIAAAETQLVPAVTAIATRLAQLKGLDTFKTKADDMKTAAAKMEKMVGNAGEIGEQAKEIERITANLYETIGYDPDASAEERLESLKAGREALKSALTDLAKRPFSDIIDTWTIADSSSLVSVKESLPEIVNCIGQVINKLERGEITESGVAHELMMQIYGADPPAYSWFKSEFNANFPHSGSKQEKRQYIATEAIKITSLDIVNLSLMQENYNKLLLEGNSDYRANIEAAHQASVGAKTNVYNIQKNSETTIREIIEMLNGYKYGDTQLTGYYPSAQLLAYVKGLNTAIESMVRNADGSLIPTSRVGRYRSLWTYSGEGMDLTVNEIKLGDIYKAQMQVDSLLAEGYNNVAARYNVNQLRELESIMSMTSTVMGMLSGNVVVSIFTGMSDKLFDTETIVKAMDTLDDANLHNLASATADLTIATDLMLSKEAYIATDLKSVFETMESWRKIDPELPITLVTADVGDLSVADDSIGGTATAALTVLNEHTGSVTVAPTVEIYDSFGLVSSVSMGSRTVVAGQTAAFTADIFLPINTLRDLGGYTAVFTFAASEAETMTIAPTFGPYVTHFNVGIADTLDYLRTNGKASQPLGGELAAGETQRTEITVEEGNSLRVFAAAIAGDALTLTVTGNGEQQQITMINDNDFILIPDASGTYTIEVANEGSTTFTYDLSVVVTPDVGAVLGLDMPYAAAVATSYSYEDAEGDTVSGIRASMPIALYETGLTQGMTVTVTASALIGESGTIAAPVLQDRRSGETVDGSIALNAGDGRELVLVYRPTAGTAAGDYHGTVTLTVAAEQFKTALSGLDWSGNTLKIPVFVRVADDVPTAPEITSAQEADGSITVVGWTDPNGNVSIFLAEDETSDGTLMVTATADANGDFTQSVKPSGNGVWYVYAKSVGESGQMSFGGNRVAVIVRTQGDQTPPEVQLVSPETDILLARPVTQITFTVTERESALSDLPTVSVDGTQAEVAYVGGYTYVATPETAIGEGTHTIRINASSEGGKTQKRYTVIVGGGIEAVVAVGKPNASVTLNGETVVTGEDGNAVFSVTPGTYRYTVTLDGYLPVDAEATFTASARSATVALVAGKTLAVSVTADELPVSGAKVTVGNYAATTDQNGVAKLTIPYGSYAYTVSAAGYKTASDKVIFTESTDGLPVALVADKSFQSAVYIRVDDVLGKTVGNAAVTVEGSAEQLTDANGEVLLLIGVGSYPCTVSAANYKTLNTTITVDASGKTHVLVLTAAGATYDETYETLTLDDGYTAWNAAEGGTAIPSGIFARSTEDTILYIQNASGVRTPIRIAALSPFSEDWGAPEYAWSADNATVTATRIHKYNAAHVETETVSTTSAITKTETCTADGETTYTATFESAVFATQMKKVPIAMLGHDLVHHDAKAATCTEIGWEAYDTCTRCDYTTYAEIAALGHDLVHHDAKPATCTEIGWNAYDTCTRCDYTTYVEIPATGHSWNTVYEWSADNKTVTATRTCANDAAHAETETANTTVVTVNATYATAGNTTYTATFENAAFAVQTKKIVLPQLDRKDVNGDAVVNVDDALALLCWLIDSDHAPNNVGYVDFDLNGDGKTDAADAFYITADLGRIVIAAYDGSDRMTQDVLLTKDSANVNLTAFRTLANVKIFFLSADFRPIGAARMLG